MKIPIHDEAALHIYAGEFVRGLTACERATLVTLSGDLGAGKTTFTQGVARALGVTDTVASPTYVIEKVYTLSGALWERLIHIDAYRLTSAHELQVLGWNEMIADPKNLILLEWPERVADILPQESISLRFDIEGEGRIITSAYGKKDIKERE
jgi:tRNA threonylcarbamoyladenosine biosynthesis protein TsaE